MNTDFSKIFVSAATPPKQTITAFWFVFGDGKMLIHTDVKPVNGSLNLESGHLETRIPHFLAVAELGINVIRIQYLGAFDGIPCFSGEAESGTEAPEEMKFENLRGLYGLVDEELWFVAARAFQIMDWDRTTLFCSRCGANTEMVSHEHSKLCTACSFTQYPRIAPAVIMLVQRMNAGRREILLSRSPQFPKGMYSIQAGFVEPGESLEETVAREVLEETGLHVRNIRYFGSQPWPFPHSLMIGFTAEYEAGELTIDGVELEEAAWYSADTLPNIPPRLSIARKLIEWFLSAESPELAPHR